MTELQIDHEPYSALPYLGPAALGADADATASDPVAEIDRQITGARAELTRLTEKAADDQAEAEKHEAAYKRLRTPEGVLTSRVARDNADDSTQAATAFERDTLAPLVARKVEMERDIEREKLSAELDIDLVQRPLERIKRAIEGCASELQNAAEELGQVLHYRRQNAGRASSLGLHVAPLRFDDAIDALSARVREVLYCSGDAGRTEVRLVVGGSPNSPNLHLSMDRPININPHVRFQKCQQSPF